MPKKAELPSNVLLKLTPAEASDLNEVRFAMRLGTVTEVCREFIRDGLKRQAKKAIKVRR